MIVQILLFKHNVNMMKYGYIQGSNLKPKRLKVIKAGVEDSDHAIFVDRTSPQHRREDWRLDFPQKSAVIKVLQEGDILVITSIADFGPQKGEASMLIAEVSLMGGTVLDAESGEKYKFPKKSALEIIDIWERTGRARIMRSREKAVKTMAKKGVSPGMQGMLDQIEQSHPALFKTIEKIWCTAGSAPEAVNQIDALLPGDQTISRYTLQRRFGYIKKARQAYKERTS